MSYYEIIFLWWIHIPVYILQQLVSPEMIANKSLFTMYSADTVRRFHYNLELKQGNAKAQEKLLGWI